MGTGRWYKPWFYQYVRGLAAKQVFFIFICLSEHQFVEKNKKSNMNT